MSQANAAPSNDKAWFVAYRMPGRVSAYPISWQGWASLALVIILVTGAGLGSGWLWYATRNVGWFIGFFVTIFPASFIAIFALVRAKGRAVSIPYAPASMMSSTTLDQARAQVGAAIQAHQQLTLQAIDHVQVAIPRGGENRARAFYKDLLGLPEQPKPPVLAKRGGAWFESAAVKVHCGVEDPFAPAKKAHIAFRVGDVQGLAARARAAGYEVVDDDLLEGHERIYIYDPFGNRLEFLKPLETAQ
jgi:catechol 2,3-dioxygenase-like lactoylglutathione lyase family enzyme